MAANTKRGSPRAKSAKSAAKPAKSGAKRAAPKIPAKVAKPAARAKPRARAEPAGSVIARSGPVESSVGPKAQNRFSAARPPATYMAPKNKIDRRWYLVDAEGLVLGRAASRIATILRGKHKVIYTPHIDTGDFVVVINAEKIQLTGGKELKKLYYSHSGHPGGLKTRTAETVRAKKPEMLMYEAVRKMIPRNPLGRQCMSKLKIYAGPIHPHQAQQPEALALPKQ
jgi:large subunit ribosomal protein L13